MPPRKKVDDVKDAINEIAKRSKKAKEKPVDQAETEATSEPVDQVETDRCDKGPVVREMEVDAPTEFITVATLASIRVPLGDVYEDEYVGKHVDCRIPEAHRGLAFDRLWRGLEAAGAKLSNGRPVSNRADVVRWICDEIAGEYPYQRKKRPAPTSPTIGVTRPGQPDEPHEPDESSN